MQNEPRKSAKNTKVEVRLPVHFKRPAIKTNLAYSGKLSAIRFGTARYSLRRHTKLRLRLLFFATTVIEH